VVAVERGGVGAWLLLLPGFRYLWVLGLWCCRLPAHDPKPRDGDNRQARWLCAAMMTLLLCCLLPSDAPHLKTVAGALAVLALTYSFGSDGLFLLRRHRHRHRPRNPKATP
jgi:hypothetical protein